MLRTAPNFNNIRNRVPAHISRHQTFDIIAGFVRIDKQNSPPEKPSLLWGSPVSQLPSAVEFRSSVMIITAGLYCTRIERWNLLRLRDYMFVQCLIYIVFLSLVSFFSFYLVWYFWNKILNTYMRVLCKTIDCEIDCDARGRRLKSYLGHQITQGKHCCELWAV